jgi:hypothetical protein
LAWFVVEADITARKAPQETRLSFFTVLVVRELQSRPDHRCALGLIEEYLEEVGDPTAWDLELIAVEDVTTHD